MACSELKNYVQKRDGRLENVDLKKIKTRIEKQCYGLDGRFINPETIANKINNGLSPGITTNEIDELTAETIAMMTTAHSDFAILAGRIAVSQLYKTTKDRFSDVIEDLYNVTDTIYFNSKPKIDKKYYEIVKKYSNRLDDSIKYERDFTLTYFGYKTLEKSYLLRIHGRIVERPQQLLMRVAIGIHGDDIDSVIETYDLMSMKYFTHASPTLFTAATPKAQLSSCFLLTIPEDSVEGIFHCLSQSASIIKYGGGLGVNVHKVRAKGSQIGGDNGQARGIVPMLRVFNNVAKYIDQGANKRPGAIAIYLEPWHADIIDFLNLKKNTGKEEYRARDLFYGLWIPDLFMKRVKDDSYWSLMCPNQSPGLSDCWGDEFERLYEKYENDGRFIERVQARDVFRAIITSQIETGTPYMLYKDACNRKSNQQNLGTIKSSNLCTEIIEYTSADEIAVCNLASIALNMFVLPDKSGYDFNKLKEITKIVTRNLNKIIDINYYPLPETRNSNERHRPIGIGVQGLADTFILLRLPFESQKAQRLNKQIFETIYYAALEASCELAEINGPYSSYSNSPVSKNVLQFDMWGIIPSDLWDWSVLRQRISNFGIRNSLLIAPMPTASTAQILGNNESTEPYTSNIYTRRVLSGEFQIVNHHLVKDLTDLGLWDDLMKNQIIANYGSIQNIPNIPDELKRIYKTVWEVSQKVIIDMAADRGPFIDQSQSMNIHLATPTFSQMVSMHFYGWEKGLKTGMYYLRTKPAAHPIQFTVDKSKLLTKTNGIDSESVCSLQKPGECDMCSA